MQHAGLEWVWRIWLEPRRLFWRYLTTNPRALYLLLNRSRSTDIGGTQIDKQPPSHSRHRGCRLTHSDVAAIIRTAWAWHNKAHPLKTSGPIEPSRPRTG